jgi:hypothetical protein
MAKTDIAMDVPVLIRIVISITQSIKHSCLLIIYPPMCGKRHAVLFNPLEPWQVNSTESVVDSLAVALNQYMGLWIQNLCIDVSTVTMPHSESRNCAISGWCNAHVLMYALYILCGYRYDPVNIKRFASMIESHYYICPHEPPEIEYGTVGTAATGALVGGLAGYALSGGSPAGLVLGTVGGLAIGSLI